MKATIPTKCLSNSYKKAKTNTDKIIISRKFYCVDIYLHDIIVLFSQNKSSGEFQRGCERLDPPGVASLAQHVIVQRVAAPALLLTAQQHTAVNTPGTKTSCHYHHYHEIII